MTIAESGILEQAETRATKRQKRAETANAKLEEQARKGVEARAAYGAAQQAIEDKTARLKVLRLAKEKAA